MTAMRLRGPMLADGRRVDLQLADGLIAAVGPPGTLAPRPDEDVLDLEGYLLLSAFAEPHAHLDKAYTAELVTNPSGDLGGAVPAWRAYRQTLGVDDIAERAERAALTALRHGATAIRSHVDVGIGIELRGLEALVRVRDALRGTVELQLVAMSFPLVGEGCEEPRRWLRRALAEGADLVGGVPHGESDPDAAVAYCLELADEFGCPVDLHVDEHLRDTAALPELSRLVAAGFAHGATASHCVSLGMYPAETQREVARAVASARVGVVCCPATNLYLQGREHPVATPRGLTALGALRAARALVAGGGDNVQDPYNPLGCGDPLETAQLLVLAGHVTPAEAYEMVSANARAVLGLAPLRIEPDAPADLVAIAAGSLREAIATRTEDRLVLRAGRIVARTTVTRNGAAGQ